VTSSHVFVAVLALAFTNLHSVGCCRGVEDVVVAEDFTFAASSTMADDVTGLAFSTRDAMGPLTLSSLGLGGQPRFRFGSAFDRLGVQALLGPAFDHLCPRFLE
jgi:hypothetical protein